MEKLDFMNFIKKGNKILSGRANGKMIREFMNLDLKDKDDKEYEINIDNSIYTISTSFFLALFGDSVRLLGKDSFKKKYKINCDKRSILRNIDYSIEAAVKSSNVLD